MSYHTPTNLVNFLSCSHLSALDRAARNGTLRKPKLKDPLAELLFKQGAEHEKQYLDKLKESFSNIVEIRWENFEEQNSKTLQAMQDGADVVYQGAITDDVWKGYSDFLVKNQRPSNLGAWSYDVEDAKLSSETKGSTIMQLCLYADQIKKIQGHLPEKIVVITGTGERDEFNPHEFMAYLRYSIDKYLESIETDLDGIEKIAPEPVERCHTCLWRSHCEDVWHKTDHLKLVADTTRMIRKELNSAGINTLTSLAKLPALPDLEKTSPEMVMKIYKQARIQLQARISGNNEYEFLEIKENQGLAGLPLPDKGDIWFDIEGNPHIHRQGLEYLFGWIDIDNESPVFHKEWASDHEQEKKSFERFIEFVLKKRKQNPGMHVYHFGHYETSVVKRLSTRYNTFVEEVDDLLRQEVFIDLHRVVKNGVRLSVESYGLKDIEGHYQFQRETELILAGRARKAAALLLELRKPVTDEHVKIIEDYNKEDCLSTLELHRWLEDRRTEHIQSGAVIPRFEVVVDSQDTKEQILELTELSEKIYKLLPEDNESLSKDQKCLKALADLLLWYRREDKSHWWEFFRMKELSSNELINERKGLAGPFQYIGKFQKINRSFIHKWKFPKQDFEASKKEFHICKKNRRQFTAHLVDTENQILEIKRSEKDIEQFIEDINNAEGVFASSHYSTKNQMERFKEIAESVIRSGGIDGLTKFPIVNNLLQRDQLLSGDGSLLKYEGEETLNAAKRLSESLNYGVVLPIQGPPGTGKTFTAAHMICSLIKSGKKVGVTAQSHAVIMNLVKKVKEVTDENKNFKQDAILVKQIKSNKKELPEWLKGEDSSKIDTVHSFDLIGATSFIWSKAQMAGKVDVLFVDEAGQLSLADAIACSHAASSMVLLGDPQQLENVTTGVHPPEVEVSALGYWLDGEKVIKENEGLFLNETWRMAPSINDFISETFYEGKVGYRSDLVNQKIESSSILNGSGIKYIPCTHEGNQSKSLEEVSMIKELIDNLLKDGYWFTKTNEKKKLNKGDILIVAPYNAQVNALKEVLEGIEIGTVDKFQGREAPLVIYSMASSSPEHAPRGMEFLYSLNRLNVAVSRAQCVAAIVSSPALFELSCETPEQMRLANGFCRYLEMSQELTANPT